MLVTEAPLTRWSPDLRISPRRYPQPRGVGSRAAACLFRRPVHASRQGRSLTLTR